MIQQTGERAGPTLCFLQLVIGLCELPLANQSTGSVVTQLVRRLGQTQIFLQPGKGKEKETSQNSKQQQFFALFFSILYQLKTQKFSRGVFYQWRLLPLTHGSHHSGQVGLPLLLVLVLRVSDQVCVDGLTLVVALESVQLEKRQRSGNKNGTIVGKEFSKHIHLVTGQRASPLDRKAPSACPSAPELLRWSSGHFPLCSAGTRSTPSQTKPHCRENTVIIIFYPFFSPPILFLL